MDPTSKIPDDYITDPDDPYLSRLRVFLDASGSETERGRVLVAASLIEEVLEEILRSFLSSEKRTDDLFAGGNAPLGTFSAKIKLARSLCLITVEEFQDIELVRKIRNQFAHSVLCAFSDPKIRDWSRCLKIGMAALDALPQGDKSRVDEPAARFSMVSTSIVSILYNRAHYVREVAVTERTWPG